MSSYIKKQSIDVFSFWKTNADLEIKYKTLDVVWPKQIGDGYHLPYLGCWASDFRWIYHMPGPQQGVL
jgi:hypothetical protein